LRDDRETKTCLDRYMSERLGISGTINVIAVPSRLTILDALRSGEQPVSALVESSK
jgi:hypothetical protein